MNNEKANYKIYSLIKAISKINKLDINELWINLIHPLDKIRLEQQELELIDIVKNNIDKIINNKYNFNEKTINKIKSFLVEKNKKKEKLTYIEIMDLFIILNLIIAIYLKKII